MVQDNSFRGPGGTIDTPVGAQWPNAPAASPGSTDFGRATAAGELGSHSETLTAQSPELAHVRATVEADHHQGASRSQFTTVQESRSRPRAAAVIGSAFTGAVLAGAIPFMLSSRGTGEGPYGINQGSSRKLREYADRFRSGRMSGRSWAS